jgi:hypothetical protein
MQGSEQQMAALAKATEVRCARARLKRQVKAGKIDGRAVLTDPPPIIHTMKVPELLRAFPKLGKTKAARIAARTNTTTLPVGRCGNATRQRIKDLLP